MTLKFNGTELTNYGLTVKSFRKPYNQQTGSLQLLNRAYPLATVKLASQAVIQAEIIAEDDDELLEYEDNIKLALVTHTDGKLEVAQYPDRYWMARLASPLEFIPIGLYQKAVNIVFDVFDPLAYANTATSSNHTIATDPDDLTETNGGTAPVRPTITITSNADHGETTVEIESATTGEVFQWTGTFDNGDVLVIDCEKMYVTLNSTASMLTTGPEYPHLEPGANIWNTSGFTGTLNITYRDRYL